ncbi:GNAT family N-acetyltransferase [Streptomyces sp. MJM1172]|uniref:GNAT family N-acetyltransferase n=1 Tax=Streptomyces sp. MJM1172 TaxID=1703926 RepID=UPI000A97AEEF|nr:GNAT family N-acetyltransferase [Streptomyces sp. MJM1172]
MTRMSITNTPEPATIDAAPIGRNLARAFGDDPMMRWFQAAEAAAGRGPQEPHWYLAVLGADPAAQGRGHGAALLRSGLAKADADGLATYLESSKASNRPTDVTMPAAPVRGGHRAITHRAPRDATA